MWRDLWAYGQALRRHFVGLATGTVVALVLHVWDDVLHRGDIPTWVWVVAAVMGIFVSGFNAWREEHGKGAPQADVDEQRRLRALADKMVDEYVALARPRHDAGPHALATLGLHALKSDALIREAIQEMHARSRTDPWSGSAHVVEDVDLVRFFE